ncbi:hypothetical protein [Amycolatopsis kentuckyensis]|uniref:hypothetical protein n=1 Tax=Amycolatopsis kentuckyensis TaxID=218823 RepID=UPI000A3BEF97|nr:hypothetical protein [Amycolatopsis kentuckyensis]
MTDVDAILASLGPHLDDPGDDRWGGASFAPCGPGCPLGGPELRRQLGWMNGLDAYLDDQAIADETP